MLLYSIDSPSSKLEQWKSKFLKQVGNFDVFKNESVTWANSTKKLDFNLIGFIHLEKHKLADEKLLLAYKKYRDSETEFRGIIVLFSYNSYDSWKDSKRHGEQFYEFLNDPYLFIINMDKDYSLQIDSNEKKRYAKLRKANPVMSNNLYQRCLRQFQNEKAIHDFLHRCSPGQDFWINDRGQLMKSIKIYFQDENHKRLDELFTKYECIEEITNNWSLFKQAIYFIANPLSFKWEKEKKIFYVDDDEGIQSLMKGFFEEYEIGYECFTSVAEVLEKLKINKEVYKQIGLVITDWEFIDKQTGRWDLLQGKDLMDHFGTKNIATIVYSKFGAILEEEFPMQLNTKYLLKGSNKSQIEKPRELLKAIQKSMLAPLGLKYGPWFKSGVSERRKTIPYAELYHYHHELSNYKELEIQINKEAKEIIQSVSSSDFDLGFNPIQKGKLVPILNRTKLLPDAHNSFLRIMVLRRVFLYFYLKVKEFYAKIDKQSANFREYYFTPLLCIGNSEYVANWDDPNSYNKIFLSDDTERKARYFLQEELNFLKSMIRR